MTKNRYIRKKLLGETEKRCPNLESFLIWEKGKILLEEYFKGSAQTLRLTASMEKSLILATAVGILLQKKLLNHTSLTLGAIFPKENLPRSFAPITVENILTNSTGIQWPGPEENGPVLREISQLTDLKLSHAPGYRSIYKPDSLLIVWITEKLSDMHFEDFLEKELFRPLGIVNYRLSLYERRGPQLFLSSRDILKIGRLYLAGGLWENRRIFSESFTKTAHTLYYEPGFPESAGYGYLWWIGKIDGYRAPFAAGIGGQYLCLIPERELIFLTTGSIGSGGSNSHRSLFRRFFDLEKIYKLEGIDMKKSPLTLDKDRKKIMVEKLISYIDEEWEQEIGLLKAELLLDFLVESMGSELYNKGVSDSRNFILKKMEDMELDMDQLKL